MKYPTRRYFTQSDKTMMWDRWQKGESLNSIARLFDTSHSAISGVLVCEAFRERSEQRAASKQVRRSGLLRDPVSQRKRSSYVPISSINATTVDSTPAVTDGSGAILNNVE